MIACRYYDNSHDRTRRCENIYFLCESDGVHGVYCCTACGEFFKRAAKQANIRGQNWRLWNKKDYRNFLRSDWHVSYTRSISLLQWATDNANRKKLSKSKKRKSKSPCKPSPRDVKKARSAKVEILTKLTELGSLIAAFLEEK